jgi:putative transposase
MPWNIKSIGSQRWAFIKALLKRDKSFSWLCQFFQISRQTGYKWKGRFLRGGRGGLRDHSRRPRRSPRQLKPKWVKMIARARRQHPHWGAKKLQAWLRSRHGRAPAARTIGQWLQRLGLTRPARRRPPKAGVRLHAALTQAKRPNQVWTVDFKGWYRTGNGQRVEPLTVRDLFSRFCLLAQLLPDQRWVGVKSAFTKLFGIYGLPEIIRVDNGGPFASIGPAGLSRLSVWWVRLGITVQFTRPAHPQDNGAHEQFHRVLKKETTGPAAYTRQGQQHRTSVWIGSYNRKRPHEALGQKKPAEFYRKSRRAFPRRLPILKYPKSQAVRQVRSNGQIRWAGRRRFVGEAFVGQPVGLLPLSKNKAAVYFGAKLVGYLLEKDIGGMRPMVYVHRRRRKKNKQV